VAIDPSTPSTLYVASSDGGGVSKSTDAGATWSFADRGLPTSVSALVIDPSAPSTLYAASHGGVFKSTDAGATWDGLLPPFPFPFAVDALVIDPRMPTTVHAGTSGSGVFSIQQVPPTPTPTSVPTSTSTPPVKAAHGDGCGIAASQRTDARGHTLALLAALVLIATRHRRGGRRGLVG
jgi:hypothetical protein